MLISTISDFGSMLIFLLIFLRVPARFTKQQWTPELVKAQKEQSLYLRYN